MNTVAPIRQDDSRKFERLIKTLAVPEGWTQQVQDVQDARHVIWRDHADADQATIEIDAALYGQFDSEAFNRKYPRATWRRMSYPKQQAAERAFRTHKVVVCGHVTFVTRHGRLTFDRLGVCDSFDWDANDHATTLQDLMVQQITRAREAIERHDNEDYLTAPRTRSLISRARFDEMVKRLKAGKVVQLSPAGFGTGWEVVMPPQSKLRQWYRAGWNDRGNTDFAAFFGMPYVLARSFDCD